MRYCEELIELDPPIASFRQIKTDVEVLLRWNEILELSQSGDEQKAVQSLGSLEEFVDRVVEREESPERIWTFALHTGEMHQDISDDINNELNTSLQDLVIRSVEKADKLGLFETMPHLKAELASADQFRGLERIAEFQKLIQVIADRGPNR
jgi:hypothetical protein